MTQEESVGATLMRRDEKDLWHLQRDRERTYLQCWQISDFEDAAMWEQYVGEEGVAITTNVQILRDHYYPHQQRTDELDVHIRATFVDYVDADTHFDLFQMAGNLSGERFLRKRMEFIDEREFRVVYEMTPKISQTDGSSIMNHNYQYDKGVFLQVDHASIFNRVVLSPGLSVESEAEVRSVLAHKGMEDRLSKSKL